MSSFFLKVAIALRNNGNLGVVGTETHDYNDMEVILWKLSKGHTMVLVRREKEHLEFKFYTQYFKVIRKWLLNDELYLLHKYRSDPHDNQVNKDEFSLSQTQKTKEESRISQQGTEFVQSRDQQHPKRDGD
ncbi:hypothetical protein VIBNIFTn2_120223 [Vibrio nigripulchritudo FTn2]|nr:hypothetical protein VIBNIFTn2_120223 [Vibrio nigripulchritudo FTn2]